MIRVIGANLPKVNKTYGNLIEAKSILKLNEEIERITSVEVIELYGCENTPIVTRNKKVISAKRELSLDECLNLLKSMS